MAIEDHIERSRRKILRTGLEAREGVRGWSERMTERLRGKGGLDLRDAPIEKGLKIGFWCFLFLGVAVAGIAADNPFALWTSWLPLFFLFVVIIVGALDPGAFYSAGGLLVGLAGGAGLLALRLWVAAIGPIPHASMQEMATLLTGLFLALAMWLLARRRPRLTLTAWTAGLAIIVVARYFPLQDVSLFRSDLLPAVLSLCWAMVLLSGSFSAPMPTASAARAASAPGARERGNVVGLTYFLHLMAWSAGGLLAKLCLAYAERHPRGGADAIERGSMALQWMWTKSAIFGWNRGPLQRLGGAMMEPLDTKFPDWMGWYGFVGAYGLSMLFLVGAAALVGLAVAHRRSEAEGFTRGNVPHLALLAAQASLIWCALGAPNSDLPFLLLCGWLGMGLTSGHHRPDHRPLAQTLRYMTAVPALAALLILLISSIGPIWARSYVNGINHDDLVDPAASARLGRSLRFARMVSPRDPKVDWADGLRLRNELQRELVTSWDETLFERTVDAYRRAVQLDPYDSLYALELANLYKIADRPADAVRAIEDALTHTPRSTALIQWLYVFADGQQDTATAMAMIDKGLAVNPSSPEWWKRKYIYGRRLGQGPQSGYALGVALTADPSDPALARSALQRVEIMGQAAAAKAAAPGGGRPGGGGSITP